MKLLPIFFLFVAFAIFKVLVISAGETETEIDFPTFEVPVFEPRDLSGGCGGFTDCIEYVGAVIQNIGEGLIFIILFIIEILAFLFALIALILSNSFEGIDGAPWWVNLLLQTPLLAAVTIILYKLIRKGDSSA